jgi:predicted naringenin-chalcone synthase
MKAVISAGTSGRARPRVVNATILFDESGRILTYTVESNTLHMARGGDIANIVQHLVAAELEVKGKK